MLNKYWVIRMCLIDAQENNKKSEPLIAYVFDDEKYAKAYFDKAFRQKPFFAAKNTRYIKEYLEPVQIEVDEKLLAELKANKFVVFKHKDD